MAMRRSWRRRHGTKQTVAQAAVVGLEYACLMNRVHRRLQNRGREGASCYLRGGPRGL
jgi:hypothetical protein